MAIYTPPYIAAAAVEQPTIRFKWDDWKASMPSSYKSRWVVDGLARASLRARIAVGIGVYEWIVFRFRSLSDDPVPLQIGEAAWAANVEPDYLDYTDFDRDDWLGPIRGPLWFAMTWLQPMVFARADDIQACESGLAFLPKLAIHVLPEPAHFEAWLRTAIERVVRFHPAIPEDPLDDLFSEREEERRGPLVAREVLDPAFDYDPAMAPDLVARFLSGLGYRENPFLVAPGAPGDDVQP